MLSFHQYGQKEDIRWSNTGEEKHQHKAKMVRNRKVLATKFDFSPFLHQGGHHQHEDQPPGSEVDPLYGVEKRRVPTGPNPLHH
ncbi:unnamed protein product [Rhodiola kirilowii]